MKLTKELLRILKQKPINDVITYQLLIDHIELAIKRTTKN